MGVIRSGDFVVDPAAAKFVEKTLGEKLYTQDGKQKVEISGSIGDLTKMMKLDKFDSIAAGDGDLSNISQEDVKIYKQKMVGKVLNPVSLKEPN